MTTIEWTDATWNPVTGCDRVSPGCAHCYALTLAKRLQAMGVAGYERDGDPATSGPGFGVTLHPGRLEQPLRWRRPRMVFVNSMSDLFHDEIPRDFIRDVFQVMERSEQHTFQVLTKRPERARDVIRWLYTCSWCEGDGCAACHEHDAPRGMKSPLPNVWLGVSIENARYTWRADVLREIPAAVRFISAEPLLGSLIAGAYCRRCNGGGLVPPGSTCEVCGGTGVRSAPGAPIAPLDLDGIDWLIAGGESGPQHRPLELEHARELRDACQAAGIAYFFKQVGGRTPKSGGALLDGREHREFPRSP